MARQGLQGRARRRRRGLTRADARAAALPDRTRFIVRREPRHPGALRFLLPSHEYRYWAHWIVSTLSAAVCDQHMRAHARVENTIARVEGTGGNRFPFTCFHANAAWLQLAASTDNLKASKTILAARMRINLLE